MDVKFLSREQTQSTLIRLVEPPRLSWRPIGLSQTDAVC